MVKIEQISGGVIKTMLSLDKIKLFMLPLLLVFSMGAFADDTSRCSEFIFVNMKERVESNSQELYDPEKADTQFSPANCVSTYMREEISVKMLFFLFGDIVEDSLDYLGIVVNDFVGGTEVQEGNPISSYRIFDALHSVMASYNIFIFAVILILLTVVYMKDLNFTAKEGVAFGDSNISTGVFSTRLVVAGLLFIPIPGLYGFSIGQGVMIVLALIGIMLANLIWYLSFSFYTVAVSKSLMNSSTINSENLNGEHMDFLDTAVSVKVCDSLDRQNSVYEYHMFKNLGSTSIESLSSNDYYNCLQTETIKETGVTFSSFVEKENLSFGDRGVALTNFCKRTYNNDVDSVKSTCGDISISENIDIDNSSVMKDEIVRSVENRAANILSFYCKSSAGKLINGDPKFNCLDVSKFSGTFYYNEDSPEIVVDPSVEFNVLQNISKTQTISLLEDGEDEIKEFIDGVIRKGWIASSLIMLEVSTLYNKIQYKESDDDSQTVDKFEYPFYAFYYSDLIKMFSGIADTTSQTTTESYPFSGKTDQIRSYYERSNDQTGDSGYSGAAYVFSFLLPDSTVDLLFGHRRESCLKNNFADCPDLGPSPLVPVIILAKDVAATTAVALGVSKSVSLAAEYKANRDGGRGFENWMRYKSGSGFDGSLIKTSKVTKVFDLLSKVLVVILFLALVFAYVLPIVMFIYFIGNAMGFFISIFKMFAVIPLWGLHHAMSKSGEGLFDDVSYGYKELLNIMLKPSLIISGVICYLLFISIIYPLTFMLVLNVWDAFYNNNDGTLVGIFYSALFMVTLAVLFTYVTFKATKIIYKIPNASEQWLGLESEKDGLWNEVKDRFVGIAKMTLYKV